MSRRRRSTVAASDRELAGLKGPNGRGLCRFCKQEVPPGKRTFCGKEECLHGWKLRSDPSYMRKHVYKRDLGVCSICKADTRYQKIQLENILKECNYSEIADRYKEILLELKLTRYEARHSLFDVDHILPVALGGGECDLSNVRTLCKKCHKMCTAVQANRRAKPKGYNGIRQMQGIKSIDPIGIKGIKGF